MASEIKNEQKNNLIFWNVDTQYDFMRKDGKLYVKDAETIEPNLKYITQLAEKYNLKTVNTADWHTGASKELSQNPDFIKTFPDHCITFTDGARYVYATSPTDAYKISWFDESFDKEKLKQTKNIVLYKDAFDIFEGSPHAEEVLEIIKPKTAVVYGVATNVCVNYAVLGLQKRGIQTYIPLDAIKELPNLPLQPILDSWKKAGAILTKTEDLERIILEGLNKVNASRDMGECRNTYGEVKW